MKRTITVTECDFCGAQTDEFSELILPAFQSETKEITCERNGKKFQCFALINTQVLQ